MKTHHRSIVRLLGRLLLLIGLLVGLGLLAGRVATVAHASPTLTVTDCSNESQLQADVSTASSDNAGDTITFACSGTIFLTSTLTISGSLTLDGSGQNVTLDGGNSVQVLSVTSGVSFTLNALTIAHGSGPFVNGSGGQGGGLYNDGGTVSINSSTFANNGAAAGGGLYNAGGTVSISTSTFDRNSAFQGGGIFNDNDGTVNLSSSTFANNSASGGGGLDNDGSGTVSIAGSIVANNVGGNCVGGVADQGYNLENRTDCGFTASTDLQNTDPLLDPNLLQNNGGPTQTIALQQGSRAIDRIPAASCPATDQRGMSRPDNGESTCDLGAYEFADPADHDLGLTNVPTTIMTNATSPKGAVVTYTLPTVVDEDSPLPTASCSPASGSTFAIGTTTVICTATDSDDTNSPVSGSFQVVVKGAAAQVSDLIVTVNSFHLPGNVQKSFDSQLQTILADLNGGNTSQACSDLTEFTNHVKAQSGKQLTVSQANQLLTVARQVQGVLSC